MLSTRYRVCPVCRLRCDLHLGTVAHTEKDLCIGNRTASHTKTLFWVLLSKTNLDSTRAMVKYSNSWFGTLSTKSTVSIGLHYVLERLHTEESIQCVEAGAGVMKLSMPFSRL